MQPPAKPIDYGLLASVLAEMVPLEKRMAALRAGHFRRRRRVVESPDPPASPSPDVPVEDIQAGLAGEGQS